MITTYNGIFCLVPIVYQLLTMEIFTIYQVVDFFHRINFEKGLLLVQFDSKDWKSGSAKMQKPHSKSDFRDPGWVAFRPKPSFVWSADHILSILAPHLSRAVVDGAVGPLRFQLLRFSWCTWCCWRRKHAIIWCSILNPYQAWKKPTNQCGRLRKSGEVRPQNKDDHNHPKL